MSHPPDDPRLTAFALGELDDADRPEIESLLTTDPDARAFIDEVQATARFLANHLQAELATHPMTASEPILELHPEPSATRRRPWVTLAIAASLLGLSATLVYPMIRAARRERDDLALRQLPSGASDREDEVPGLSGGFAPSEEQALALGRDRSSGTLKDLYGNDRIDSRGRIPVPTAGSPDKSLSDRLVEIGPLQADPNASASPSRARESKQSITPSIPGQERGKAEPLARSSTRSKIGLARDAKNDAALLPPLAMLADQTPPLPSTSTLVAGARMAQADPAPSASPAPVVSPILRMFSKASSPSPHYARNQPQSARQESAGRPILKTYGASPPGALGLAGSSQTGHYTGPADKKSKEGALDVLSTVDPSLVAGAKPAAGGANVPLKLADLAERRNQKLEAEAIAQGEAFAPIQDNPFLKVADNPLSTFSIDVDTASYATVRRYLNQNALPPRDAVRIEEMVNYFPYRYAPPRAEEPFSVQCEVARCPWEAGNRLVRIGLKGREIDHNRRPPSNLVFLIDVSGSMEDLDKLPLLKAGMKILVDQLGENDRVAIVVYAAQEGLALNCTRADRKAEIQSSLEQLQAGGSTNGGKGIQLAYDLAVQNFIPNGTNRVILATDGDFNVGVTEGPDLDRLIESKRESKVFLSVLGFGQGNVKHDKLESLANKGNGQYFYIDSIKEARKVLVEQMGGTLMAIAKDVKIQVEFDPIQTSSYRLIGYENRLLEARDFADDKKDAGEIGAGHCVTALYEVAPAGDSVEVNSKLQASNLRQQAAKGNAKLLEVRLRYKAPEGDASKLLTVPADDDGRDFAAASADFRFASAVAGFGMLLRDSPYKGTLTWDGLIEFGSGALGGDPGGYRSEFLDLARKARTISAR